ncbi:MAG: ATP-binding protein, partial [Dehalococcoidales bacterium]|nr:ATP-binding protein [Dehalococcoidales bacterium]
LYGADAGEWMAPGLIRADKQSRGLLFITPTLAGGTVLITLVVLIRWLSGFFQSASSSLQWVPMAPLTAILFLLVGSVLLLRRPLPERRFLSNLARAVFIFVFLVSAYILLHNFISSFSLDIEDFLASPTPSASDFVVGRMSPVTAILFIMVSISLLISTFKRERPDWLYYVSNVLTLGVFITALVILSGYWYGAPFFYGGRIIPVAVPTAVSFLLVSTAQLFDKSENFFYRFLTSRSVVAQICRPIMPISLFILLGGSYLEEVLKKHVDSILYPEVEVGSVLVLLIAVILAVFVVSRRVEQDITRKEMALRESEEKFRNLAENAPIGITLSTPTGSIIDVNKVLLEIYGYASKEEFINVPFSARFYDLNDRTRWLKLVQEQGKVEGLEIQLRRKDGTLFWASFNTLPQTIESGEKRIINVIQDITERKKLQEQLIAQDRLVSIGQLVSGVAHELNNPLTSVVGFSELILQRELPDDVKADLKIVNDEAKRTSLIVKNLLTFARQQPQEKRVIDINESIQTVLQLRSHEESINNLKVNTHLAPELPRVIGNGSQLQQVFFNIVTKAEQAMLEAHHKGVLTVTTEQLDSIVRVSLTDDGPGISPENMKKLFTPFFTTKEIGKGTGLGLSICHGIITEHGGRIHAESPPGQGATFIIDLPVSN